jgi:hypothetical protein
MTSEKPRKAKGGEPGLRVESVTLGLSPSVQLSRPAPPEPEAHVARRVIAYMEDRRVLYQASALEIPRECVESVLDMRRFLTGEIGALNQSSELVGILKDIRAACRKFLDEANETRQHWLVMTPGHYASWVFYPALGALRNATGAGLDRIARKYGLTVEPDLASIFPAEPRDDDR